MTVGKEQYLISFIKKPLLPRKNKGLNLQTVKSDPTRNFELYNQIQQKTLNCKIRYNKKL